MFELLFQIIRVCHILCGFTGFLVAPVALIVSKGSRLHRSFGIVYVYAMTAAALTAIVMTIWKSNLFFLCVATFSAYLAFSGYRSLRWKASDSAKPSPLDWGITGAISLVCVAMIILSFVVKFGNGLNIALAAFGTVGFTISARDLWKYIKPPADPNHWFYDHMIGMISSYTAAVSAFSVTNLRFLPPLPRILWPSMIGIPLLIFFLARYRRINARNTVATVLPDTLQ